MESKHKYRLKRGNQRSPQSDPNKVREWLSVGAAIISALATVGALLLQYLHSK